MGAASSRRLPPPPHPCTLCGKRSLASGCHVRIDDDLSPACRACWEHAYYSPRSFLRRLDPSLHAARIRAAVSL